MSICDWHHTAFSDSVIKSWHLKNINLKQFLIYYYLFPCGCAGSVSLCGLSSSCGGKDYSLVAMCRLPIAAASPAVERGLCSFSCCGARALQLLLLWSAGSAARGLQQLCLLGLEHGLAVLAHGLSCSMAVGPSLMRDWTHVSCTGRQVLYYWAYQRSPLAFLELIFLNFSPCNRNTFVIIFDCQNNL